MKYRLLDAFEGLFSGKRYLHRVSNQGDQVARHFYEDLVGIEKSAVLEDAIRDRTVGLNTQNKQQGIKARRGDGTLGELVPNITPTVEPGFVVARGPVATIEIGIEVKILAKAMLKQLGRVRNDLEGQVDEFHRGGGSPITVGIVGINQAPYAIGYEGDRSFRTDGKSNRHPIQEAAETERQLLDKTAPKFDHFMILRYRATNDEPYPFDWIDYMTTFKDYGAMLARVARDYNTRFGPG